MLYVPQTQLGFRVKAIIPPMYVEGQVPIPCLPSLTKDNKQIYDPATLTSASQFCLCDYNYYRVSIIILQIQFSISQYCMIVLINLCYIHSIYITAVCMAEKTDHRIPSIGCVSLCVHCGRQESNSVWGILWTSWLLAQLPQRAGHIHP